MSILCTLFNPTRVGNTLFVILTLHRVKGKNLNTLRAGAWASPLARGESPLETGDLWILARRG